MTNTKLISALCWVKLLSRASMGKTANEDQQESISEGPTSSSSSETSESKGTPKKGRKRAITGFGFVMLAFLAFAIFGYLNFTTVEVQGRSMFPTFHTGQRVLVGKAYWIVGPIKDGDVVVLKDGPTGHIIKRVYKMGGETVDWKYVPGDWGLAKGPYKVREGCVYVLGDNLKESEDSRVFHERPLEDVVGKVIVRK